MGKDSSSVPGSMCGTGVETLLMAFRYSTSYSVCLFGALAGSAYL